MAIADKKTATRSGFYVMIFASTLIISACAAPPGKSPDESVTTAAHETPIVVAEAEIVDDFEGDGMEIPLDGTSLETFEASLAQVKRHTSEDSYETLQKAVALKYIHSPPQIESWITDFFALQPEFDLEYFSIADIQTLEKVSVLNGSKTRAFIAIKLGGIRLIDNIKF